MKLQTISNRLADWVYGLSYEQIPASVMHKARRAMLDTIGVIAAGGRHAVVAKTGRAFGHDSGRATLACGGTSNLETAALVNGCAAHAYDYDDVSHTGIMHGSAVIGPAVFATTEERGLNDLEALVAFVAGSEVAYVLGDALSHEHFLRGWWTTATLSTIGAAAAAAKLHGLSAGGIEQVIGLAAGNAGGTRAAFGTDGKPFLCGIAAKSALEYAIAISSGITGPTNAFESDSGFVATLNDGIIDLSNFETLGESWRLLDPGLMIKRYPICSSAHALTEESAELKLRHNFHPDEVVSVECAVPQVVATSLVYDNPKSPQECQFSIPYSVASGLQYGKISLRQIASNKSIDATLHSIMKKVSWRSDPELSSKEMRQKYPECARVMVQLPNQVTVEGFRAIATGAPGVPMRDEQLIEKFLDCLEFAGVDERDSRAASQAIMKLGEGSVERTLPQTLKNIWGKAL